MCTPMRTGISVRGVLLEQCGAGVQRVFPLLPSTVGECGGGAQTGQLFQSLITCAEGIRYTSSDQPLFSCICPQLSIKACCYHVSEGLAGHHAVFIPSLMVPASMTLFLRPIYAPRGHAPSAARSVWWPMRSASR